MEDQENEHCYGNCEEFNDEPVTSVPINTLGRIDMRTGLVDDIHIEDLLLPSCAWAVHFIDGVDFRGIS